MSDRYARTATSPAEYAKRVLPDSALERAPEAVVKANTAASAALDSHRKATTGQRTADIEARNADQADMQATKGALDAGKNPPKATAPAKRDAAEQAKRTTEAATALVTDRFAAFDHTIREHHREWLANERATLDTAAEEAQAAVTKASEAFSAFEARTGLVAFLLGYDPDRNKTQSLRHGSLELADGETVVQRNPGALMDALHAVAAERVERLTTAETALDHQAAEHARRIARKAIRHQQLEQRNRKRKTTPGVNAA
jgi:hypothetical protein